MVTRSKKASETIEAEAQWLAKPASQAIVQAAAQAAAEAVAAGVDSDDGDETGDAEESPVERVITALSTVADPLRRTRIALYKIDPDTETESWCLDYKPEALERGGLGLIRDTWGPGSYILRVMGYKPGSSKFTRLACPEFTIAPDATRPANPIAAPAASGEMSESVRAILESNRLILQALTNRSDPMADMRNVLAMMASFREAMGLPNPNAVQPQKSTIGEIVDAIKELKDVNSLLGGADKDEPKSEMGQLLEAAKPVLEAVGAAVAKKPESVNQPVHVPILRTPRAFGDLNANVQHSQQRTSASAASEVPGDSGSQSAAVNVQTESERAQGMQAPSVPSEIVAVDGGHSEAASQANSPESVVSDSAEQQYTADELKALQEFFATLMRMAASNGDPDKAAELIYEKLPEDGLKTLLQDDWWLQFSGMLPAVVQFEAWFKVVREAVVRIAIEEGFGRDDPTDGVGVGEP